MADNDNDLVLMLNPDLPGSEPQTTTRKALREVWGPRGFEEVPASVAAAGEVLGQPVPDLEGLTKAQLLEVAATLGIEELSQRSTNADIIAAIEEITQAQEEAE